jgi:hypothetical protein
VPTEFKLLGNTIHVKKNPDLSDVDKYGVSDYQRSQITLYTHECTQDVVWHTFHHELVHFLLVLAGRPELSEDESLVDVLGGLLAQYEITKK